MVETALVEGLPKPLDLGLLSEVQRIAHLNTGYRIVVSSPETFVGLFLRIEYKFSLLYGDWGVDSVSSQPSRLRNRRISVL